MDVMQWTVNKAALLRRPERQPGALVEVLRRLLKSA